MATLYVDTRRLASSVCRLLLLSPKPKDEPRAQAVHPLSCFALVFPGSQLPRESDSDDEDPRGQAEEREMDVKAEKLYFSNDQQLTSTLRRKCPCDNDPVALAISVESESDAADAARFDGATGSSDGSFDIGFRTPSVNTRASSPDSEVCVPSSSDALLPAASTAAASPNKRSDMTTWAPESVDLSVLHGYEASQRRRDLSRKRIRWDGNAGAASNPSGLTHMEEDYRNRLVVRYGPRSAPRDASCVSLQDCARELHWARDVLEHLLTEWNRASLGRLVLGSATGPVPKAERGRSQFQTQQRSVPLSCTEAPLQPLMAAANQLQHRAALPSCSSPTCQVELTGKVAKILTKPEPLIQPSMRVGRGSQPSVSRPSHSEPRIKKGAGSERGYAYSLPVGGQAVRRCQSEAPGRDPQVWGVRTRVPVARSVVFVSFKETDMVEAFYGGTFLCAFTPTGEVSLGRTRDPAFDLHVKDVVRAISRFYFMAYVVGWSPCA